MIYWLGIPRSLEAWMNLSAHCDLSSSEDSSYSSGFPHISVSSRYGLLAGQGHSCLEKREVCVAVLSRVVGSPSDLYQIGVTKVVPIENPILIPLAQPFIHGLSVNTKQLGPPAQRRGTLRASTSLLLCLVSSTEEKILAFQIKNRREASGCFSSMTTSFILPAFFGGGLGCWFSCFLVTFITLQFPAPEPSSANTSTFVMWAYISCPFQLGEYSFLSREPYGQ